jgi:hypothetical protein
MRAWPVLLRYHGYKRLEEEQHPLRVFVSSSAYEHKQRCSTKHIRPSPAVGACTDHIYARRPFSLGGRRAAAVSATSASASSTSARPRLLRRRTRAAARRGCTARPRGYSSRAKPLRSRRRVVRRERRRGRKRARGAGADDEDRFAAAAAAGLSFAAHLRSGASSGARYAGAPRSGRGAPHKDCRRSHTDLHVGVRRARGLSGRRGG